MTNGFLNLAAIALYLIVGLWLWRQLNAGQVLRGAPRAALYVLALIAIVLHAAILYGGMLAQGGLNLDLTNAFSLVAWAVVTLFLVASLSEPIETLGVLIMPTAALTILLHWLWPGHYMPIPQGSALSITHVIISLLAYSLLSVAVVQGLMLGIQERRLHQKQVGRFLAALPPLQTMEHLMFQMITIGFLLLTLTLITGIFFSEAVFGKPVAFTHHIVLSIFAWAVFAILLFGRWRFGWRGRLAVRWAVGGFGLLALAYFGTKFVLEILLGR